MYYIMSVQVVNSKANMNEDLPNKIINEKLAILPFYKWVKVMVLAILHYYVYLVLINDETI